MEAAAAANTDGRQYASRSAQSLSRVQLCDPVDRSTPGLPVHHQLPQFTQTHVHRVGDAIQLSRECMLLDSLSRHNKDLEGRTLKPPRRVTALRSWIDRVIALRSRMDHVIALRQISVTALFYLEESRKIHLSGVRARRSKETRRRAPQRAGERERESWLWLLYLYVYLSLGLSYVNWASLECCLFYLRSSLRS